MSKVRRWARVTLWSVLAIAVILLALTLAVLLPIITHQSAGGSGWQQVDGFPSETSALGADNRTREISVETLDGEPADLAALEPGQELVVRGTGFDASIGIYVAICVIPDSPTERPSPCLGGVPEGASEGEAEGALASAWVTNSWAWRNFATGRYDDTDAGSFTARITVPAASEGGVDCGETQCAIATRADHTAGSDRVQDMLLPVAFAE